MPRSGIPLINPRNENNFRGDRAQSARQVRAERANEEYKLMPTFDPSAWNLDDAQEPYALKDGTEARLRILEVTHHERDDKTEYLNVRLEVPDEPYSKEIAHFLNIPTPGLDAKRSNQARSDMDKFLHCFNIDRTRPFNPSEDWVGEEGWAILGIRRTDAYGEQNKINKFILPR